MDLLNNKYNSNDVSKPEISIVQKHKHEYKHLGQFLRTRGLKLFGFNYFKDEVFEVEINYSNTIHIEPIDGKLMAIDYELEKCQVDSRFEYFEALNYKNALKRVNKYKSGKIKELCNLRIPNPDGISFF